MIERKGINLVAYNKFMKFTRTFRIVCIESNFENCLDVIDFFQCFTDQPVGREIKLHIVHSTDQDFPKRFRKQIESYEIDKLKTEYIHKLFQDDNQLIARNFDFEGVEKFALWKNKKCEKIDTVFPMK